MTTMPCSRCGRDTEVEYGTDGLAYCSSCIFYGTNKQCWKCRMYLPANELQQYKGLWVCPYCLMDMRDEVRRRDEREEKKVKVAEVVSFPEMCERCGRDLTTVVYIWNGKRLCKSCLDEEKDKWDLVGGGPSGSPMRVNIEPVRRAKKVSLIERLISGIRGFLGLSSRRLPEQTLSGRPKMPIGLAKPMMENQEEVPKVKKEEATPQVESIYTRRHMTPKKEAAPPAPSEIAALEKTPQGIEAVEESAGKKEGEVKQTPLRAQRIPKKMPGGEKRRKAKKRSKKEEDEKKEEEDIEKELSP